MLDSNIHFSDVLVIGSGLAGQSSALAASKYSNHVTILSKVSVMICNQHKDSIDSIYQQLSDVGLEAERITHKLFHPQGATI